MASLGTLTLDLVAQVGSFIEPIQRAERQVEESAGRIENNLSSATDGIKEMALAAAGAFSAGALFSRFIEESKSAQAEQAQLAAVLKSTGESAGYSIDQLNEMADSLANVSSFGGGDINQAQTALLAFTGVVGKEFPRAMQAAVDMATRTGTSVVSAAETIGRALDVPSKGLTALSKQGFRFTDDQKAMAEQLEATGRTAEAQGIILEALESSYKGAGLAARNTFDGALFALDETIGGLLTSEKGISGITTAVNGLNDALSSDITKTALEGIVVAATGLSAVLVGRLVSSTVASTVSFVAAQREAIRYQAALASMAGVSASAAAAQTVLGGAVRGALALAGGWVGLIATGAILATGFLLLRDNSDDLTSSFNDQSKSVVDLTKEYNALNEAQQRIALRAQNDRVESLTQSYTESRNQLGLLVLSLTEVANAQDQLKLKSLAESYNQQKINAVQLSGAINQLGSIGEIYKDGVDKQAEATVNNANALMRGKSVLDSYSNSNVIAGKSIDGATNAANRQTLAINEASEALQKYLGQQQSSAWKTQFAASYSAKNNLPTGFGNMVAEAQQANDGKGLTQQQTNDLWKYYQAQQAVTKLDKQRSDASALAAKNSSERNKADDKAVSDKANKAKQIQDTYNSQLSGMKEQAALYGVVSNAAKIRYQIENSELSKLEPKQKQNLINQAERLDKLKQEETFRGAADKLLQEQDLIGQNSELYKEMYQVRVQYEKDLSNEQIKKLQGLTAENYYAKEYYSLLLASKPQELKDLEATSTSLEVINKKLAKATLSEKERNEAIKLRSSIIGASTLPSYTPELSGAAAIGAGGTLSGGQGKMFEAIGAGVDLDKSYLDQKAKLAEQYAEKEGLEAEHQERLLLLNADYAAKRNLVELGVSEADKQIMLERLSTAEATFGGLADLAKVFAGEQSGVFKAMFAAQKAMQIATALINIPSAASKAYDSMIGVPFVGPVLAVGAAGAAVAAQLLQVAKIRSTNLQGMAHDGIDSVPKTGTWLLEEGERVMTSKTSAKLDRTLEKVKDGPAKQGLNLNIQNFGTSKQFEVQQLSANDVRIICRDEAPKAVAADMQHPNSVTSKSLKSNFDVGQRR